MENSPRGGADDANDRIATVVRLFLTALRVNDVPHCSAIELDALRRLMKFDEVRIKDDNIVRCGMVGALLSIRLQQVFLAGGVNYFFYSNAHDFGSFSTTYLKFTAVVVDNCRRRDPQLLTRLLRRLHPRIYM